VSWALATVGKPALAFAREGTEFYLDRIRRTGCPIAWEVIRDRGTAANSEALLSRTRGRCRIVLDERGRRFRSLDWARWIGERRDSGTRDFALLIAGSDGHDDSTRSQADLLLSLSDFTYQHELAALLALEQLYRAQTILQGHPYHRE